MAAVGVDVTIGRQTIVNTNASVDHESILGDGVHIMPGATVAGEVMIGSGGARSVPIRRCFPGSRSGKTRWSVPVRS